MLKSRHSFIIDARQGSKYVSEQYPCSSSLQCIEAYWSTVYHIYHMVTSSDCFLRKVIPRTKRIKDSCKIFLNTKLWMQMIFLIILHIDGTWSYRRNKQTQKFENFQCEFLELVATLLNKRLWQRCFSENIVKFLRAPFL